METHKPQSLCGFSILGYAVLGSVLYSALGALNGTLGTSILMQNYEDYDLHSTVIAGAIGGGIVGASGGLLHGILDRRGVKFFAMKKILGFHHDYVATIMINAAIGHAVASSLDIDQMPFEKIAGSAALGAAITAPCLAFVRCCTTMGLRACNYKKGTTIEATTFLNHEKASCDHGNVV